MNWDEMELTPMNWGDVEDKPYVSTLSAFWREANLNLANLNLANVCLLSAPIPPFPFRLDSIIWLSVATL